MRIAAALSVNLPIYLIIGLGIGAVGGCDDGEGTPPSGECLPGQSACEYSTVISEVSIQPGEEIESLCQSWTLNNPEELWVTTVSTGSQGGYHHSNWFFVPDDYFAVPDGTWPCSEQNFNELSAAIAGGFLYAQSTQVFDETQTLPQGAAIRIPPYSRIVGNTHLLNLTDEVITTRMSLSFQTIPRDQVTTKMVPARITYSDLHLYPNAISEVSTECDIAATYEQTMGRPLELEIYFAVPHYHELGIYAELQILGGPRDGEVLYRTEGYGHAFGHTFDPPVDLAAAGARGIRYTCGFMNPRSQEVGWGIGDQEMCVVGLMFRTNMAFDGLVYPGDGEEVGVREDGTIEHAGACTMLGVPWNHDKPGGPAR